jgi:hypothetical protein
MAKKEKDKVFWIGDNGDNKSVNIARKIYGRGDEIPAGSVPDDMLKAWEADGLISIGSFNTPVVVDGQQTIKGLEAEVRDLKVKLDMMPGLQKENGKLKDALAKAKSGKDSEAVKAAKDEAEKAVKRAEIAEADVEEKAALIEKQAARIAELEAPGSDADNAGGAGPGGS